VDSQGLTAKEIDAQIARLRSVLAQARGPMPLMELEVRQLEEMARELAANAGADQLPGLGDDPLFMEGRD
jgi:hypothetical protein